MDDPWDEEPKHETVEYSDRDRVTVTMKGGAGFEEPWIVIHAKDVTEANTLIHDIDVQGLMSTVGKAAANFRSFGKPHSPSAAVPRPAPSNYRPPVQQAPHDAPSDFCPVHQVPLVYNAPFTSGGKTISARMACPERGCRAITYWHNKDGSWKRG